MPNQRDESKRKVGVWLDPTEWEALDELSRETGITKSDLMKMAIQVKMKKETIHAEKKSK